MNERLVKEHVEKKGTWLKHDDGCVSIGSFIIIHHDLGRSLASVTQDCGPLTDVATAVHHRLHLSISLIHLVLCLPKLDFGYCRDTQQ